MNADALLAEILANPDDDAPRLIYADWLEEHGDPDRAAFIRAQVRLAHFNWRAIPPGAEHYPGEREALASQEAELWRRHKEEWLAELPVSLRRNRVDNKVEIHRGFVEELSQTPKRLLKVSSRVWARHPIRQLTLWPRGDEGFADVLALPHLGRIRQLSLMSSPDNVGLAALAGCDSLSNVRVMTVFGDGDPTYAALARCPSLRGLLNLFLMADCRDTTEAGLTELIGSENVAGLVALRIDAIYLPDAGARVVARSARLAGLKRLSLHGHLKDAGAQALCESPYLAKLECLEVSHADWQPQSVRKALRKRFGAALRL
jgi:uncharacterized protein (TIGR02996 family)